MSSCSPVKRKSLDSVPSSRHGRAEGLEALRHADVRGGVGQLAHAPQRITQRVLPGATLLTPDAPQAIGVIAAAIAEHLREARGKIE